jgi:hypothetical protein
MTDRVLNAEIKEYYSNKRRKMGMHDKEYDDGLENEFLSEEELRLVRKVEAETEMLLAKMIENMKPPPVWVEPSGWKTLDAPWRHSIRCKAKSTRKPAISAGGSVMCECRLIPLVVLSPGQEHMEDCVYVDDVELGRKMRDCVCVDVERKKYFTRK